MQNNPSAGRSQDTSHDFSPQNENPSGNRRRPFIPGRDHPNIRHFFQGMGEMGYHIALADLIGKRYGNAFQCMRLSAMQIIIYEIVYEHCVGGPIYRGSRKQVPIEIDWDFINWLSGDTGFHPTTIDRAIKELTRRRVLIQVGNLYRFNLDYVQWIGWDDEPLAAECVEYLDSPRALSRSRHSVHDCDPGFWDRVKDQPDISRDNPEPGPDEPGGPDDTGGPGNDPGGGGPSADPTAPTQNASRADAKTGRVNATASGSLFTERAPASDSGLSSVLPEFKQAPERNSRDIYIPETSRACAREGKTTPGCEDASSQGMPADRCCDHRSHSGPSEPGSGVVTPRAAAPGVDYDPAIVRRFREFCESKMILRNIAYNCYDMEITYHSWWLMKAAKRAWIKRKYTAAYIRAIMETWTKLGEPDPGPEDAFDDQGERLPADVAPRPGEVPPLDRESVVAAADARQAQIEEWSRMMGEEYDRRYGERMNRLSKQRLI